MFDYDLSDHSAPGSEDEGFWDAAKLKQTGYAAFARIAKVPLYEKVSSAKDAATVSSIATKSGT